VRKMNKMPSSTSRRSRRGRPRASLRRFSLEMSGSSTAHWVSVRSRGRWGMLQWISETRNRYNHSARELVALSVCRGTKGKSGGLHFMIDPNDSEVPPHLYGSGVTKPAPESLT